jgi:hypothetical protein
MKDDVYGSKTPLVPVGTDMTDETNYAVYVMKREQNENQTSYGNTWNNSMDSRRFYNVRYAYTPLSNPYYSYGWGMSPLGMYGIPYAGIGYYYGSSYFCGNHFGYYSPYNSWYSPGPYGYMWNSPYGPYNYLNYSGMYFGTQGYFTNTQYSKPVTPSFSSHTGSIHRNNAISPNVNYGNSPRKLGLTHNEAYGNQVKRESASGATGSTYPRSTTRTTNVQTSPNRPTTAVNNNNNSYSRSPGSTVPRSVNSSPRSNSSNSNGNFRTSPSRNNSGTMRGSGSSGTSSGGGRSTGTTSGGRTPVRR